MIKYSELSERIVSDLLQMIGGDKGDRLAAMKSTGRGEMELGGWCVAAAERRVRETIAKFSDELDQMK